MAAFTEQELAYLAGQPLMRFASASPTGQPDVATVAFSVDGDDIVTAGFDIARTVRYRNIGANPRAAVVIDDLAALDPWTPRGIKVRGRVRIEGPGEGEGGGDAFVHISAVERAGMVTLRQNQRVSYELEQDKRGKTSAVNLQSAD